MGNEYFEPTVPADQRTSYVESAAFVAWIDAVRTWRAAGCVDAQPVAPDLMHAIEVWRGGVVVETQSAEVWRYDLRGLDLREQNPWIGKALIKFGDRRLWATIGTQLPGEHAENFGAREAAISMALGLMRAITISRGPCNDAVADAIAEQLVAPAEAILRLLATIELKGPTA
jgi:hypothetical protein